ncbi:hypothetical protein MYP_2926 [Sporocytophaga myxococcoides]|uniref:Outer membrane protein beta-barrel domain-containing protein n=1 Tax=Sporocytophaga myxococcoides TaxID=153721 RepID=A0A098LGU5_9BACT|nr:hypothetical protein [Sporocytophaga myxococcoides]GAL85697.1 hypothetical protein MYP_2926 [Sporocytophaga myxococcoides]
MIGFFKKAFLLVFIFANSRSAFAADSTLVRKYRLFPRVYTLQYAGNLGFLSGGLGYSLIKDKVRVGLFYGYVPKIFSTKAIHTIALKGTLNLFKSRAGQDKLYIGTTFNMETGNNSFLKLPDKYPKGYYQTNAFHFTIFTGVKSYFAVQDRKLKGVEPYIECGTVDTYLYYCLTEKLSLLKILSLSAGLNLKFK